MVRSDEGEAFTDLLLETFRLNGRLLAAGDRLVADLGLTSARWQVLGALAEEPRTVSGIARAMGLTRQAVQRVANELVAEGFLAWRDNPAHRRAKLVDPTERGRTALAEIERRQAVWADRVAQGLGSGRLAAAAGLLRDLRRRLEEE
ncbi:MAG: MarR family transcriptional regulator [Magnetospirillum sp. WYHS-4]